MLCIGLPQDDGFIYKLVNEVDGDKPENGQMVSVYYTGYLEDGTKFDSAYDKGRPFEFRLGKGKVITGWEAVVGGMKVRARRCRSQRRAPAAVCATL